MENIIKGFMAKFAAKGDTSVTGVMPNLRSGLRTKQSHGVIHQSKPKSNISIAPRTNENPVPTPTTKLGAAMTSSSTKAQATTVNPSRSAKSTGSGGGNRGLTLGKARFGKPTGKLWTSVFRF